MTRACGSRGLRVNTHPLTEPPRSTPQHRARRRALLIRAPPVRSCLRPVLPGPFLFCSGVCQLRLRVWAFQMGAAGAAGRPAFPGRGRDSGRRQRGGVPGAWRARVRVCCLRVSRLYPCPARGSRCSLRVLVGPCIAPPLRCRQGAALAAHAEAAACPQVAPAPNTHTQTQVRTISANATAISRMKPSLLGTAGVCSVVPRGGASAVGVGAAAHCAFRGLRRAAARCIKHQTASVASGVVVNARPWPLHLIRAPISWPSSCSRAGADGMCSSRATKAGAWGCRF